MSDDKIEIFFAFDPIPDAILDKKDLPKPIIKIIPSRTCKMRRNVLFVKLTENRKENDHEHYLQTRRRLPASEPDA